MPNGISVDTAELAAVGNFLIHTADESTGLRLTAPPREFDKNFDYGVREIHPTDWSGRLVGALTSLSDLVVTVFPELETKTIARGTLAVNLADAFGRHDANAVTAVRSVGAYLPNSAGGN